MIERSILIVDDEETIRQSLIDYFEDRLWRVIEAESGEAALKMLDSESPPGAIVDIRLGGMFGDTFIREACRKSPATVVFICTGSTEYEISDDLLNVVNAAMSIGINRP